METLYDVVQHTVRTYGDLKSLGTRDIVRTHEEQKEITKTVDGKEVKENKTWKYYELSVGAAYNFVRSVTAKLSTYIKDYKYLTFNEVGVAIKEIGSGLSHLGLNRSTHFNIFASTSAHWLIMAMSCFCNSITFCTAYDSLGSEGLEHSLNEPEVVGVFTDSTLLRTLADAVKNTPTVRVVVYDGELKGKDQSLPEEIAKVREGMRVVSLKELRDIGKSKPKDPEKPKPQDTACIMYTSVFSQID